MSINTSHSTSKKVFVVASDKMGDQKIDAGSMSLARATGAGASVGAAVGTVVPVIGNTVGTVVGGAIGGIGRALGLFGSKKVKVTDVMRPAFIETFRELLPGRVTVGPHKGAVLAGEYDRAQIEQIVQEIAKQLELASGGGDLDTRTDVHNYTASIAVLEQTATPDLDKFDVLVEFNKTVKVSDIGKVGQHGSGALRENEERRVDGLAVQTTAAGAAGGFGGIGGVALVLLIVFLAIR